MIASNIREPVGTLLALILLLVSVFGTTALGGHPVVATTNDGAVLSEPEFSRLLGRAVAGDVDASMRIALHSLYGVDNMVRGAIWVRFAAHGGSLRAQVALASQFLENTRCRNVLEARYWLARAAAQGDAWATEFQRQLVGCEEAGETSIPAIEALALNGDVDAAYALTEALAATGQDEDAGLALVWATVLLAEASDTGQGTAELRGIMDSLRARIGSTWTVNQVRDAARDLSRQLKRMKTVAE